MVQIYWKHFFDNFSEAKTMRSPVRVKETLIETIELAKTNKRMPENQEG